MVVKPKTRGFICTTAHPTGCEAAVREQAAYIQSLGGVPCPKRVLVIGASTGYGLACRIASAFGAGAATIGVSLEQPASGKRTATAGWYNTQAFDRMAVEQGLWSRSINGDAFSDDVKAQAIAAVKELPGGQADLVIYSVAAPRRTDPKTGKVYNSVIKPIGSVYESKSVDFHTGQVSDAVIAPATPEETEETIKVMGGEDWLWWLQALQRENLLAQGACTVAFSYIGPVQTHPVYKDGTIGKAKEDLEVKAGEISALLSPLNGKAFVSVNKALVTQAAAAIPVVPLYISILYKLMKEAGTHEGCIEQMARLYTKLYPGGETIDWSLVAVDEHGRIRMDDREMDDAIQRKIPPIWDEISSDNAERLSDLAGYRDEFFRLFGFGVDGVDYDADVEI